MGQGAATPGASSTARAATPGEGPWAAAADDPAGHELHLINIHTISGQAERFIPGKDAHARSRFKKTCVKNPITHVASTLAATQSASTLAATQSASTLAATQSVNPYWVVMGDCHLTKDEAMDIIFSSRARTGVILSPGLEGGVVPSRFFVRVLDLSSKAELWPLEAAGAAASVGGESAGSGSGHLGGNHDISAGREWATENYRRGIGRERLKSALLKGGWCLRCADKVLARLNGNHQQSVFRQGLRQSFRR